MPLERHWERVHTPLRSSSRRETRVLVAVAAVVLIATVALLFAVLRSGSSDAGPGCIKLTVASSTGGATLNACGADAQRWCSSVAGRRDAFARQVSDRCRSAGYPQ